MLLKHLHIEIITILGHQIEAKEEDAMILSEWFHIHIAAAIAVREPGELYQ